MPTEQPSAEKTLKVKVYPYRKGVGYGNIIWPGKFEMRDGRFPKDHPVGGDTNGYTGQYGSGDTIKVFRARGYWASCFPEGDGITWEPLNGQSDEQCIVDIRESFGWDATWGVKL